MEKKAMALGSKKRSSFLQTLRNIELGVNDYTLDKGASAAENNRWLFEVAWEVANKGEQLQCDATS